MPYPLRNFLFNKNQIISYPLLKRAFATLIKILRESLNENGLSFLFFHFS